MKSKCFCLALIVLLVVTSCTEDEPVLELFSPCDESEVLTETDTGSTVVLELLANTPLTITNPEMAISIYGSDNSTADIPASLITKQCFSVAELPVLLSIAIPKDPTDKIEFLNNTEAVRYYVAIEWDSDGNGKRCIGDISQDYDRTNGTVTLNINSAERHLLYLSENESVLCD